MTELETIQRAKMYMDKLANGINPIDDTRLPESDAINHERLSKCFAYVSGILHRVIENGGVPPLPQPVEPRIAPFLLSDNQKKAFEYSDTPIPISEIAKRLNALINEKSMVKIKYQHIRSWLSEIGMLEMVDTISGGRAKHPTEAGAGLGISVEKRTGTDGDYQVVLYDKSAQQFILDNIDAITEVYTEKRPVQMHGKPWTKDQEERLTYMYRCGIPVAQIAEQFRRSPSGIRSRLNKLGLIRYTSEAE